MDTEHIEKLLELPEDDLLILIGDDISSAESRFSAPDTRELVHRATVWLEEKHVQFQNVICENKLVIDYCKKDDLVALVVAIGDLIAGICINISPFTVATLIVKKGIDNLCDNIWKSKEVKEV